MFGGVESRSPFRALTPLGHRFYHDLSGTAGALAMLTCTKEAGAKMEGKRMGKGS